MNKHNHFKLMLILGALAALGPFAIDMYLPGFKHIAADFHTDVSHVGLSLTSYFAGICIGQILCGPLVDRFGRRKPLLIGLVVFMLAAVGCGLAPGLHWLIALRLLLALGACVGMVASRAIIRDLYPPTEIAKIFSTLMLIMGAAPILAPMAGSFITTHFGWRAIFAILTGFTILLLGAVYKFLPESHRPDPSVTLNPKAVLRDYRIVLKNPSFMVYALTGGLGLAAVFSYISGAPMLFLESLHMDPQHFSWLFGLNALGYIGAAQINQFILRYTSPQRLIAIALMSACVAALGLVGVSLAGVTQVWPYSLFIFLFMASMGPLIPNTTALALQPFRKYAGTASALIGSIQMLLAALASGAVSEFSNGTPLPTALVIFGCAAASMLIMKGQLRKQLHEMAAETTTKHPTGAQRIVVSPGGGQ